MNHFWKKKWISILFKPPSFRKRLLVSDCPTHFVFQLRVVFSNNYSYEITLLVRIEPNVFIQKKFIKFCTNISWTTRFTRNDLKLSECVASRICVVNQIAKNVFQSRRVTSVWKFSDFSVIHHCWHPIRLSYDRSSASFVFQLLVGGKITFDALQDFFPRSSKTFNTWLMCSVSTKSHLTSDVRNLLKDTIECHQQ